MLKIVSLRILVALAITISSSSAANAGFLSPDSDSYFAAANWTLTTNGGDGSGTITTDAMTLISNDAGGFDKYVRYSITIPTNIETISFRYQWSTTDGWIYDTPSYFVGSTQTNICTWIDRICSGTVTNLDFSSQVGQQFIFQQNSLDGCCGRATLVISEINGVITRSGPTDEEIAAEAARVAAEAARVAAAQAAQSAADAAYALKMAPKTDLGQCYLGSDKVADPTGEIRGMLDEINRKYGNLIK